MVHRHTFELVKRRHSAYASWAVWAQPTDTTKTSMGDLSVLDPALNPALLASLRNDAVMLGLNVSTDMPEPAPFRNFHYAGRFQDYKTRYAFADTPFWGAYMTDLIKDTPMLESKSLKSYLKSNPSVLLDNIDRLVAEFDDLGAERPTVLAFGGDVHRLFIRWFPADRYARVIPLRHYSDYISPVAYRKEVLDRLAF